MFCGAVQADAITSDIVGYNNKVTDGTKYPIFGASFLPVNGAETYKLGALVPSNSSTDDDVIQVINSTTLGADKMYHYVDKATADYIAIDNGGEAGDCDDLIGWWDGAYDIGEEEGAANNVDIDNGAGFLGLFESGNEISFQSAGEAPTAPTSIMTDGSKYPIIANYIPKTIKLGWIVPENASTDDDLLQVINSTTLGADKMYHYVDKATADYIAIDNGGEAGDCDDLIGWWDGAYDIGEEEGFANNVDVDAGDGFLGLFESGNEITFNFPSSLYTAE